MKSTSVVAAAMLGMLLAVPLIADAQPAKGKGGWGGYNVDNTRGWSLMTPEEGTAHQSKMQGAKTVAECQSIQEEHRKVMEARAKEKGTTLGTPRYNACEQMRAQGVLK